MTQLLAAASVAHTHVAESEAGHFGWRICTAPKPSSVLGVVRASGVLRVVLGEEADPAEPGGPTTRVLELAAAMTADRRPLQEVADVLSGSRAAAAPRHPVAPASITLIDLHPDGLADIACRYSPSLMYSPRDRPIQLLPPTPGPYACPIRLSDGDRLLAYTPSFLESQQPQTLVDLPTAMAEESDPCALWSWITSAPDDPAAAPELVIISRSGNSVTP